METSQLLGIIHASEEFVLESFHGGYTTYANSSHSKEVSNPKAYFFVQRIGCTRGALQACTLPRWYIVTISAITKALAALQTACRGKINLLTKTAYR